MLFQMFLHKLFNNQKESPKNDRRIVMHIPSFKKFEQEKEPC